MILLGAGGCAPRYRGGSETTGSKIKNSSGTAAFHQPKQLVHLKEHAQPNPPRRDPKIVSLS